MTLRSTFAKRIGIPIKSLIKREENARILADLRASQWNRPDELHALRTRRLRHVLVEIARNVPYYRERIREIQADPTGEDPWQILAALPAMDKQGYRSLGDRIASETPQAPPILGFSSGTTGERLQVKIDPTTASYRYLAGFRAREWWGVEQGDEEFKIWGSGVNTAKNRKELAKKLIGVAKDWMVGVTLVSPFFKTDADFRRTVALLFRRRPSLVFGYSNSIYMLAAYMKQHGISAGPGWPKVVFYTSEQLFETQREVIAEAFGCPVVPEYGSSEAGVIATTCPDGRLHSNDDILAVEILGEDADGLGEIVVTSLLATDYPLVRYRQGDLGRLDTEPCPCGRGLGTISGLKGRMNDCFRSPSGGIVDFIVFDQAMKDQPAIRRFKIVERGPGDLVFVGELHDGKTWLEADRDRFLQQCARLLPDDVRLSTRTADHLPNEPSGKFRIMVPVEEAARYLGPDS